MAMESDDLQHRQAVGDYSRYRVRTAGSAPAHGIGAAGRSAGGHRGADEPRRFEPMTGFNLVPQRSLTPPPSRKRIALQALLAVAALLIGVVWANRIDLGAGGGRLAATLAALPVSYTHLTLPTKRIV